MQLPKQNYWTFSFIVTFPVSHIEIIALKSTTQTCEEKYSLITEMQTTMLCISAHLQQIIKEMSHDRGEEILRASCFGVSFSSVTGVLLKRRFVTSNHYFCTQVLNRTADLFLHTKGRDVVVSYQPHLASECLKGERETSKH